MRDLQNTLQRSLLLLLAIGLAGCSSVQFGYGQSERLLRWYVTSYVDLDSTQTRALNEQLGDLKSWHCTTQLGEYSAWLRKVRDELSPGLSADLVQERTDDVQRFFRVIADDAAPRMAKLILSLKAAQIAELKSNLAKDNVKFRKRWVDVSADQYRAERADRMRQRLKYWFGPLTPEQNEMVQRWTQAADINSAAALESRERWQQAMLSAIERRAETSEWVEEVHGLMTAPDQFWTDDMKDKFSANRARTYALIRDVANVITPSQKQHVDRKLSTIANDFDQLTCSERRAAVQQ